MVLSMFGVSIAVEMATFDKKAIFVVSVRILAVVMSFLIVTLWWGRIPNQNQPNPF